MPQKVSNTARRLKEAMDLKGLRQVDLLEKLEPLCKQYDVKLQKNALSQYLSGKVIPRQDKLYILGIALDVSEAWLMGYDVMSKREEDNDVIELDASFAKLTSIFNQLSEKGKEMLILQAEFLLSREESELKKTQGSAV